ncbi:hypothetical protein H072_9634 [Dactylellina haptotyla CBS 200.50]|uniref:deoxyribose-phosphate aldolase n=1 Tax=Dactylellina haptotyla (strain CBS 200.50) TaxID=1284197 RepID=S8A6X2_DACHA|nr:hypothetical protein H072_9634 [Dactylellina haptotyla CBS 200.50]
MANTSPKGSMSMPTPRTTEELAPLVDEHVKLILSATDDGASFAPVDFDLTKPSANLAKYIDHTLLKPEATTDQVQAICEEAVKYGFKSCCVNSVHIPLVASIFKNTPTNLAETTTHPIPCSVVGFPLGAATTGAKCYETSLAIVDGAKEIDMVISVGHLKSKNYGYIYNDINAVVFAAKNIPVKVIIETSLLPSNEEKIAACYLAAEAGAAFVKTSTGFNGGGATVEDVRLMKRAVEYKNGEVKVKASGGVRTFEDAINVIKAGADRIGASSGVAIMSGGTGSGY